MPYKSNIGKISGKKWTFEWEIDDIFSHTEEDLILYSPDFVLLDHDWYLGIYPNGLTKDNCTEYISLYLFATEEVSSTVVYKLGLKTVNNTISCERTATFDNTGRGYPMFVKRSDLLQRKSELVPTGVLTVTCSVAIRNNAPDLDASYRKLAEDFKSLFTSKSNADITLNVKEKVLPAHKAILEARSSVFAAMFKNDMVEKQTGEVDIPDCDPDTFNVFLLFLYSGEQDFKKCNVCDLYKICDKYDVEELKLLCVSFMAENLSVENFGEILILADTFHEELPTKVQDFFNENFKQIFPSDSWKYLSKNNFRLANNLLNAMALKVQLKE